MILRACVVIPTFDNPETIVDVIRRTLSCTPFPILVVDDGSNIPVDFLLTNGALPIDQTSRINKIRFLENEGKGAALQAALAWCLAGGFTHMITLDGDGQHFPEEIHLLTAEMKQKPANLIIGNRKMDATAPGISHFGRRFSNFWVRYQSAITVTDSQSGFRVYPLFPLQTMKFLTTHFDFEIEILVRSLWRGIEVSNIPVRVLYQPPGERVSHFHKIRDNARISLLNAALVVHSLFRLGRAPLSSACAVGLGVLVGCTPFFGMHTFLVAVLAIAFRLNAPLLWIGSQISIPPLAPFLAFASIKAGAWLQHRQLEFPPIAQAIPFARDVFLTWLLGSIAVGLLLGTVFGALTYFSLRAPWRVTSSRNWTGQTRGGRIGNGLLILVLRRFGLNAGYFCLTFVYPYFYFFAPKARQALDEYWRIIRPEFAWLRRQREIFIHFRTFARVLMDRVYENLAKQPFFKIQSTGFNCIIETPESRGILLVGAHVGNADLAAARVHSHGIRRRIHTLQHESQHLTITKVAGKVSPEKVNVIYVSERNPAIFQIHQVLNEGGMIGLMVDRPLDHNFELVPFFGKLVPIASSPFRIALASGAQLTFTFGFKSEGCLSADRGSSPHIYENFAASPKPAPVHWRSNRDLAAFHFANEFARILEEFLSLHPHQWFNFYRFFSASPTLPNGGLCVPRQCQLMEELLPIANAPPPVESDRSSDIQL